MSTSGGTVAVGGSTPLAGHLAADYAPTAALATFLTTASLGIGVWQVNFGGVCVIPATLGQTVEMEALAGTATVTFEGQTSDEAINPTATGPETSDLSLTFLSTVTVAGTLVFQALSSVAATATIKATTPTSGLARATGYTATRVG